MIYQTIVKPVVTYDSNMLVLTQEHEKIINVFEKMVLRMIYGPINESGQWRSQKDQELMRFYRKPDIMVFINMVRI